MKKHSLILLILLALLPLSGLKAQHKPGRQLTGEEVERRAEADTSQWQLHGSIYSGFYSGWGMATSYFGAAPTVTYQANDHLWLAGTAFVVGGTQMLVPYSNGRGLQGPDFVPGQMGLLAYGGSLSMKYETKRGSNLCLHLSVVNDRAGLFAPMFSYPCWGSSMLYHGFWGW